MPRFGPALIAAVLLAAAAAPPAVAEPQPVAVIRVLDKVTARVRAMDAPIDQPVQVGTLSIVARACDKRPPEETPLAAAFLEISEGKAGEPGRPVFVGWMFSSSPSLSAMEHPIYDVWVIDCESSAASASSAASSDSAE